MLGLFFFFVFDKKNLFILYKIYFWLILFMSFGVYVWYKYNRDLSMSCFWVNVEIGSEYWMVG